MRSGHRAESIAVVGRAGVLGVSSQLLLVVAVSIRLVSDSRIPRIVRVEGSKAAISTRSRLFIGSGCGTVVAMLELAEDIVEPADDAAASRFRGSVRCV